MRVLVTGGSGFVGRVVVQRLAGRHEVFAVARDPARLPPGAAPVVVDLGRPFPTSVLPERLDAIVHLAQSRRYREFPAAADDLFTVNVAATARLLEASRSAGVGRVVLASTGTVREVQGAPAGANSTVAAPPSFFAATKLAAEMLLWPYAAHLRGCVLRLFFPYGPGQTDRLIPDLVARVRAGTPVELAGATGMPLWPTFVDDVADVFVAALEEGWTGCLDVAAPGATSLLAVAEEIGHQLRVSPVFDRRAGPAPIPLTPDTASLGLRYDLGRFRPFREGLARVLSGGV